MLHHNPHEKDRHARMLAVLMGKKAEGHLGTPHTEEDTSPSGEADANNEIHGGISEHGMAESPMTKCPHCGGHLDTNLAAKDGGAPEGSPEEEASETPEEEAGEQDEMKHKGRLFGHHKPGLMIAIGRK